MSRFRGLVLLLWLIAGPAVAQSVATSTGPSEVDVTLYRDPQRDPETAPDLQWLEGYALISETRQVSIPDGESVIRFEGVAGGILPQSAIVTGFPEGIVERNRDAYLLSPATLLDRSLGRRVHLRRTSLATGAVREQDAVIRSGADGAVVLQTADGVEALRCTGLREALVYDEVPQGLSSRPTLSVRTRSSQAVTATVTLSYLASGFDWQANYVASLSPDGRRVDLFAWLTLASSDETSFVDADTQAVAGRLNREIVEPEPSEGGPLSLRCWPSATTSDISALQEGSLGGVGRGRGADEESIIVTGSRIPASRMAADIAVMAVQENLGDVKLYRIPEPVTLAANSQKQVAFLQRERVAVEIVYRQRFAVRGDDEPVPAARVLVTRNRTAEGLGVPLPAGRLVLFGEGRERPILLGEGSLSDRAIGEDVEVELGPATSVYGEIAFEGDGKDTNEYRLTVTNDQPFPVRYEAEFLIGDDRISPRRRLTRRNGRPLWVVTIPANGSVTLRYRATAPH